MSIQHISIKDCVHYRGYRYGGYGNNLYEDYIKALVEDGSSHHQTRQIFINRLLAYQGQYFGDALGIKLSRNYKPWVFPWNLSSVLHKNRKNNIQYNAYNNPDIVCHDGHGKILASHINREFFWLEQAKTNMERGYNPERNSYIRVQRLSNAKHDRYLVLDGNHRLSALHCLGYETAAVQVIEPVLCNKSLRNFWPGVLFGDFLLEDALHIFDRYFMELNPPVDGPARRQIIFDEPIAIS